MSVSKTYYHVHPNSRYIKANGDILTFTGGQLTTEDPEVIADLDKAIKGGASYLTCDDQFKPDVAVVQSHEENTAKTLAASIALAKEASGRK